MAMTETPQGRPRKTAKGYILGRRGFAKISAVEGIRLSPEMEARFREFDQRGLSPSERRSAIAHALGKAR